MEWDRAGHKDSVAASRARSTSGEFSFADLYLRYHARVWRTLSCLGVPDTALEDAVQDVFVVVFRRLGDPDRYASLRSWLYAVARRVAWRHHRARARRRRKLEAVGREPSAEVTDPEERAAEAEAVRIVMSFLDQLEHDQRAVFVLADIEGLSAPQIAEIVEAKVATVYSRLRLARRSFARVAARHSARARREAGDG